jgi:hypothetical protein
MPIRSLLTCWRFLCLLLVDFDDILLEVNEGMDSRSKGAHSPLQVNIRTFELDGWHHFANKYETELLSFSTSNLLDS